MFRTWVICVFIWCAVGTMVAQPKMKFDKIRHDFGIIQESSGTVSYEFRFVNMGTVPVILTDVRSSCDCTVPEWPQEPILPQKQGVIKVVFETTGNPGIFDKSVTVYANTRESTVTLRITGTVERSDVPAGPGFFQEMGGLHLSKRYLSFGEITDRQVLTGIVETYNPGKKSLRISFGSIPKHVEILATPATLQPGEKGQIRVVYDASSKKDWGFLTDRLPVVVDGVGKKEYALLVSAEISEDFSQLTPAQKQVAPKVSFERQVMILGTIRRDEKKLFSVNITNSGKSPLMIRKLETGCECVTVVKAPSSVPAGATAKIECSYVGEKPMGAQQRTLSVRSNDPANPVQSVKIQAQIVE